MFTGLVEGTAELAELIDQPPGKRLVLRFPADVSGVQLGDSISINGCCLTVVQAEEELVHFEAGSETLSRTNLGRLQAGDAVNIERSLCVGDRLGGHWVTGHVDAVAIVDARQDDADWSFFWFRVPGDLTRQMASKGSIAVDGVSLTLVDVERQRFSVALIPHTLQVTTLGQRREGDAVNLETDVLAKYIERQLAYAKGTM